MFSFFCPRKSFSTTCSVLNPKNSEHNKKTQEKIDKLRKKSLVLMIFKIERNVHVPLQGDKPMIKTPITMILVDKTLHIIVLIYNTIDIES